MGTKATRRIAKPPAAPHKPEAGRRKPEAATKAPPGPSATVGERLIACREATGKKKVEVARIIKITPQSLGNLESGASKQPASDTLLDMRDKLGYSPDYIIRGKGMPLLPKFEELAQEQSLILIFRELRPELKKAAIRTLQDFRRAQNTGPSVVDPFQEDPPDGDDD